MADAPEGFVSGIVGQVADPGVHGQGLHAAGQQVDHGQVAVGAVVRGEEDPAAGPVIGQRGHGVQHGPFDVADPLDAAALGIQGGDVGHLARVVDAGVKLLALGVVEGPGHRAHLPVGQSLEGRHGILADDGQVGGLPLLLGQKPVRPFLVQGPAERPLELAGEIAFAVLAGDRPVDHLAGPVLEGQVGEEARTVKVGDGPDLVVDGGALAFQSDGVVERRLLQDLGPEDHLVIGAQGPPQPAVHPGLHEDGDALQIPARRIGPRTGQVGVDGGQGILLVRHDLAEEEPAEEGGRPDRLIHGDDVGQLVVHDHAHALVGRHHVVGMLERG